MNGNPVAVARRVAAATKVDGTAVRNIREQTQQTVSSITTVDLTGIAKIESVFAVLLAAAAMGLFVGLGLAERRHEFATMAALGVSLRQISAFLWSESALVLGAGLLLAAGLGWLLARMLVAMLQHVFDPPPDTLAVPWTFLGLLAAAAIGATVVASGLARSRHPPAAARRDTARAVIDPHVILLEDDAELRSLVSRGLREEGFARDHGRDGRRAPASDRRCRPGRARRRHRPARRRRP